MTTSSAVIVGRDRRKSTEKGGASVRRLAVYLRLLTQSQALGINRVCSRELARMTAVDSCIVRRDMAAVGVRGVPSVGFSVEQAVGAIERFLGRQQRTRALVLGIEGIGSLFLRTEECVRFNLDIVASFHFGGGDYSDQTKCHASLREMQPEIAIISTPVEEAQNAADFAVRVGVRGIWNLTGVQLRVPEQIAVRNEDLSVGLAMLSRQIGNSLNKDAESRLVTADTDG